MLLLTCGSRDWEGIWGEWRINMVLNRFMLLSLALESPLRLMNGACPTGADAIVQRWADRRDIPVEEFPANWLKYGKAAGPIRNEVMIQKGPQFCVGFLKNNSRGTQGCMDLALAAKIPTFPVLWIPSVLTADDLTLEEMEGGIPPT